MQVNHAPGMIEKCPGGISTCSQPKLIRSLMSEAN